MTPQEFHDWLEARVIARTTQTIGAYAGVAVPSMAAFTRREHDRLTLALTLFGEIRGGSYDDKIAVANVVVNRAGEKRKSIVNICLQPMQFSCWTPLGGRENHDALMVLVGNVVRDLEAGLGMVGHHATFDELLYLAEGAISGGLHDNTHGATHYYVKSTPVPHWAIGKVPCAVVGPHLFFNDIAW